jgi:hypothetical protein
MVENDASQRGFYAIFIEFCTPRVPHLFQSWYVADRHTHGAVTMPIKVHPVQAVYRSVRLRHLVGIGENSREIQETLSSYFRIFW